ncbi:hypothetical protein [Dyadobacter sp. CY312]|uniref:hypothetical protein n=1 Tax=Dyadobacter sp. CY312 TaxID=2907303 RepID=UPI001F3AFCD6|nr:hypothetical protein [Dyadobacter sp. CY312]MCE7042829.1 hypothetical protein [Dyadobacter sp. CY312]
MSKRTEFLKPHLVDLLLEDYKQRTVFKELKSLGIDLTNIRVNNYDIVLDIIGFPRDNSGEYNLYPFSHPGQEKQTGKKEIDEGFFSRDWLWDKNYEVGTALIEIQDIEITEKGLLIKPVSSDLKEKEELNKLVDWLFEQWDAYQSGISNKPL